MLNKNTIELGVWTLASQPYAKRYEETQAHHMILNRGPQRDLTDRQAGRLARTVIESSCQEEMNSW